MFQFSGKLFIYLQLKYYKKSENGSLCNKPCTQLGPDAQASGETIGLLTYPHQPFCKQKTFNMKTLCSETKTIKINVQI